MRHPTTANIDIRVSSKENYLFYMAIIISKL